jgi:hypothetical protein
VKLRLRRLKEKIKEESERFRRTPTLTSVQGCSVQSVPTRNISLLSQLQPIRIAPLQR